LTYVFAFYFAALLTIGMIGLVCKVSLYSKIYGMNKKTFRSIMKDKVLEKEFKINKYRKNEVE